MNKTLGQKNYTLLIWEFPFMPKRSTATKMARKIPFLCVSLLAYVVFKYETKQSSSKLIVRQVDKTFFHINLKVFSHISLFCHPRTRIMKNTFKKMSNNL